MNWIDAPITVTDLDIDRDVISVTAGPETYTFAYSQIVDHASGTDAFETVKRNIAVRLSLSGIDLKNAAAVKNEIAAAKFKYKG